MNGAAHDDSIFFRIAASKSVIMGSTIKGARYSYRSVVLRNVLSLSARRSQIDLRG